jgi:asparagine synthase (glutamine-hydrolysing)
MTKILGYISSGHASLNLAAMLAEDSAPSEARAAAVLSQFGEGLGLAVAQSSQLARSADGRYVCAVDGRVHSSPRLQAWSNNGGPPLSGLSAAETVLAVYLSRGLDGFQLLEGGFVFAILDTRDRTLVLGRDLFGVKNLFYAATPSGFVFSTSLARLARTPWFDRSIGLPGFLEYLACGYVSTPWTIYEQAAALKQGQCAVVRNGQVQCHSFHSLEPADWRFLDTAGLSELQLVDRLDELLSAAVARRLPGKGPVAAYLSGGLDTSLLCAALKEARGKEAVAYTMGFPGRPHDETAYARAVADHLGLEHRPFALDKEESLHTLSRLPGIYGQPLADISAIPTCLIARRVSEQFDAIFDGQGPDFLFGNFDLRVLYHCQTKVPRALRHGLSRASQFLTRNFFQRRTSPNLDVAELLRQPEFFWIFTRMFKSRDLEQLVGEPVYAESFWCHRFLQARADIPLAERLRLAQFLCYGINDVLFKASGAHNASQVDILCPFFDLDLYNFVQFLPTRYKFRGLYGKYLQKKLLYRKVPPRLLDRPKRGFIIDFVEFGVETTRALTDRYLTRKRLNETGLFNADFALRCVEDYYHGDRNMGPKLWTLLMFEIWRESCGVTSIAN